MSTKDSEIVTLLIVISLTVVAGFVLFYIVRSFFSFIASHWVSILLVILAVIGFGLFKLFQQSDSAS